MKTAEQIKQENSELRARISGLEFMLDGLGGLIGETSGLLVKVRENCRTGSADAYPLCRLWDLWETEI